MRDDRFAGSVVVMGDPGRLVDVDRRRNQHQERGGVETERRTPAQVGQSAAAGEKEYAAEGHKCALESHDALALFPREVIGDERRADGHDRRHGDAEQRPAREDGVDVVEIETGGAGQAVEC